MLFQSADICAAVSLYKDASSPSAKANVLLLVRSQSHTFSHSSSSVVARAPSPARLSLISEETKQVSSFTTCLSSKRKSLFQSVDICAVFSPYEHISSPLAKANVVLITLSLSYTFSHSSSPVVARAPSPGRLSFILKATKQVSSFTTCLSSEDFPVSFSPSRGNSSLLWVGLKAETT